MSNFVVRMDYEKFVDSFSKVKDFPLPGKKAQLLAAPLQRLKEMPPEIEYTKISRKAAVLLYCFPKGGLMHLSLIKRSSYDGVHSNQISFPGGKPEPGDQSLSVTAIRECKEELGTSLAAGKKLIPLTPIYIPPSNFLVSPFVGYEDHYPHFNLDSREVASHIELPLFKLLDLQIEQNLLRQGPHKGTAVPCYTYNNHMIWGATAMILTEFKVYLTSLSSN
jgi:8-oxo-dGTP pyrophosphatase MutT (NUDIX family)